MTERIAPESVHNLYRNSTAEKQLGQQRLGINPPIALFTDFDGTHYRHPEPGENIRDVLEEMDAVTNYLLEKSVPNFVVTGQSSPELGKQLRDPLFIVPLYDGLVLADGSKILVRQQDGAYKEDLVYQDHLQAQYGDSLEEARVACSELMNSHSRLWHDYEIRYREFNDENRNKFSPTALEFNWKNQQEIPEIITMILYELMATLPSFGPNRLFIDTANAWKGNKGEMYTQIKISPVTKADGINYLLEQLSCQGIFAGNGRNDVAGLLHSNVVAGIVVGGHEEELANILHSKRTIRGNERRHLWVIEDEGKPKLLYKEPDATGRTGPRSLLAGLQTLERFAKVHSLSMR